jgi:hypothetical protein
MLAFLVGHSQATLLMLAFPVGTLRCSFMGFAC